MYKHIPIFIYSHLICIYKYIYIYTHTPCESCLYSPLPFALKSHSCSTQLHIYIYTYTTKSTAILYPHFAIVNLPTYQPLAHRETRLSTNRILLLQRRLVVGLLSTVSITADPRPSLAPDVHPFLCWDLPSMVICCPNVTWKQ